MAASTRISISLLGADGKVVDQWSQSASQEVGELKGIASASSGVPRERVRLYLRVGSAIRELEDDARTLGAEIGAALPPLTGSPARGAKVRTRVEIVQKLPGLYDASEYLEHERGRPDATIPVGTLGTVSFFEFGLATIKFGDLAPQVWGEQELRMLAYEPVAGYSIEVRGDDKAPKPTQEAAALARTGGGFSEASLAGGSQSLLTRLTDAVTKKDKKALNKVLSDMSRQADIDMADFQAALRPIFQRDQLAEAFFQNGIEAFGESDHLRSAHGYDKTNLYFYFRATAMHYGPSLRPIQSAWTHGASVSKFNGLDTTCEALAVMKDNTIETWEERAYFQAQAGLLDGALQAQAHMGGGPEAMIDDPVKFFTAMAAAAQAQQEAEGIA